MCFVLALLGGYIFWSQQDAGTGSDPDSELEVTAISKPAPATQGYVGSQACRECHKEVYDEYQGHPMAQSLFAVADAPELEKYDDNPSFTTSARRKYSIEKSEDGVLHREVALSEEGDAVYDQGVEIHYAMGSGRRGRSYVINRDGWLYMSPVAWYSEANRWDLAPGYSPGNHSRFSRQALDRCVQCHAGRMSYRENAEVYGVNGSQYSTSPFIEATIGCERCHGPGDSHIKHRRAGKGTAGDPVVNPEKLPGAKREAVCNQCHLQGEYQILRYGRKHSDFRPGQNLGENWSIFIKSEDSGPTEAVSHMEQMQRSVCFQKSAGRLGCISCHDAHSIPHEREKVSIYASRCMKCHEEQGCSLPAADQQREPARGSCIACHMPRFSASDVPHTAQTDHRVLRAPADNSPQPESNEAPSLRLYDADAVQLTKLEQDRAQGLILANRAESYRNPDLAIQAEKLLLPFNRVVDDDLLTLDGLASCCVLQGRPEEAISYWERALGLAPRDLQTIYSLMAFSEGSDAARYAERYLAVNPWNPKVHLQVSRSLAARGDRLLAIDVAERAQALDPSNFECYGWLIQLHRQGGDSDQVQELVRAIERLGGEIRPVGAPPPNGEDVKRK